MYMDVDSPGALSGQSDIVLLSLSISETPAVLYDGHILTGSPPNPAMYFFTHSIPSL